VEVGMGRRELGSAQEEEEEEEWQAEN